MKQEYPWGDDDVALNVVCFNSLRPRLHLYSTDHNEVSARCESTDVCVRACLRQSDIVVAYLTTQVSALTFVCMLSTMGDFNSLT